TFTPHGLSQGAHTLVASETATGGNTGTASLTFTYATVANVPNIDHIGDVGPIGGADHIVTNQSGDNTVTGTAEAGSAVTLKYGTNTLGAATADGSGNWTYTLTSANYTTIGQGSGKTVTATAADAAGNTSASTTSFSFTVDTVAPTVTVSLANDTGSSSTDKISSDPTLTGSDGVGTTVTVKEGTTTL